ncbi:MAG: hypothetical protein AAB368_08440, partial [bacterium]
ATLTVEANSHRGMHAGKQVASRVAEALEGASGLLATLAKDAAALAGKASSKTPEWVRGRLTTALRGLGLGEEMQDQLLAGLALLEPAGDAFTAHEVVTFLGQAMTRLGKRAQTYPLERLAGRVLLSGIDAALDRLPEYSDVDVEE